jgi:hypothetical protein
MRFMFRVITPAGVTCQSHPHVTMSAMDKFLCSGVLPGRYSPKAPTMLPSRRLL